MIPFEQLKEMIDRDHKVLSICHQCELLGSSRSSLSYTPSVANSLELEIMKEIDLLYIQDPTRGTRRMHKALNPEQPFVILQSIKFQFFAILDLFNCFIVGWSLFKTMTVDWVVNTINEAVKSHGIPKIINSVQ